MIDLHIHLDGSLSLKTVKKLLNADEAGLSKNDEVLSKMMQAPANCKDLNEYLTRFDFAVSLLQTKEALKTAAYDLCCELKDRGLIYAEIRFAPQKHTDRGLTQEDAVQAVLKGMKDSGLRSGLILCCMRGNDNREQNLETVYVAKKYIESGVCAIDLAGAEALYPTQDFEYVFSSAKSLCIPYTIHAGEADGPKSVYKAIEMGAKRIGHGVRSVEDEDLVKTLSKEQIPLEVCVKSNIDTGVFETVEEHTIKKLYDSGVFITVNTDNTTVSATSLGEEYGRIIKAFSFSDSEIEALMLKAAEAAFVNDETKTALKQEIKKEFELPKNLRKVSY